MANTIQIRNNFFYLDNQRWSPKGVCYQPGDKARYLRGYFSFTNEYYYYGWWLFSFDGRELPPAAAAELFKDDTPGNIISPTGLFNRDYVFKQFHREKPSFEFGPDEHYHDLRKDLELGPDLSSGFDLDADNYAFTGGDFPQLIIR